MIRKVELLVHAGAPSSRKDDDKYKAQAEAYFAFEGTTVELPPEPSYMGLRDSIQSQGGGNDYSNISDRDKTTVVKDHTTIYLDDTQLAYTALDSQLATSSLAIPDSVLGSFHVRPDAEQLVLQRSSTEDRHQTQTGEIKQPSLLDAPSSDPLRRKRNSNLEFRDAHPPRKTRINDNIARLEPAGTTIEPDEAHEASDLSYSSYLKSPVLDRPKKKAKVNQSSQQDDHLREQRANGAHIALPVNEFDGLAYVRDVPIASTEHAALENVPGPHDSTDGYQTTSELPTSYSLSDITSDSSRVRQGISQRSASDPGPRLGSISPTAVRAVPAPQESRRAEDRATLNSATSRNKTPNETEMRPVVQTGGRLESAKPQNESITAQPKNATRKPALPQQQDVPTATIETKPRENKNAPQAPLHSSEPAVPLLAHLSTSITPPQPSPSLSEFTTHITEALNYLATDIDVTKTYKPISVSRELRPLERGYWLVDCSPWPLQLQIDFWRFLEKHVGSGRAGWGVWCTRGDEESLPGPDQEAAIGSVKVFCWGEVVKHVYLLLYVASKSQVRKLGLQWIDSGGKVVVQMRRSLIVLG